MIFLQGRGSNCLQGGPTFAHTIIEIQSLSAFKQMLVVLTNVTSSNHEEISTNMDPGFNGFLFSFFYFIHGAGVCTIPYMCICV